MASDLLTAAQQQALTEQLQNDPRIGRNTGRLSGGMTAAQLRALGYNVPDGFTYTWGGRSGYGQLQDEKRSAFETAAPYIAAGMGTVGGLGALGAIPGIAGVGAAPTAAAEVAGIDSAIGGMGSDGWGAAGGGGALGGLRKVGEALTGKALADTADGGFDWTKLIPIGLGAASAIRGATRGPTQSEQALSKMMASAQNRVDTMEPTFQALAKMVGSQLPDYTKAKG